VGKKSQAGLKVVMREIRKKASWNDGRTIHGKFGAGELAGRREGR